MTNESSARTAGQGGEPYVDELDQALVRDEFFLVYQPTMDLRSNGFAGVEALLRWRTPDGGVVGPEAFIPALERSGAIVDVGKWALGTACNQGAVWHAKGYRFPVSVNISAKQLESPTFVHDVRDALARSRFNASLLVLEFSQDVLLRHRADTSETIEQLNALGVRVAVDDFIPGVSSLTTLEQISVDIVKLDRHFVNEIAVRPENLELVQSLVEFGKEQNLIIVASGIEDVDQRRRLQVKEINLGQGYLFFAPQEVEEIDHFLEDFAIFSGRPL